MSKEKDHTEDATPTKEEKRGFKRVLRPAAGLAIFGSLTALGVAMGLDRSHIESATTVLEKAEEIGKMILPIGALATLGAVIGIGFAPERDNDLSRLPLFGGTPSAPKTTQTETTPSEHIQEPQPAPVETPEPTPEA